MFEDLPKRASKNRLFRKDLGNDPFNQLLLWLQEAEKSGSKEWNAMALATATAAGKPSCRIVLLKELNERGLVFYTNYNSRKSQEIDSNPFAVATFFWSKTMRQVTIEGSVKKISRNESEEYFRKRPRDSQIGAWASPQGAVIPSYLTLERLFGKMKKKYKDAAIPLPPFWGGFRITPSRFEFWSGGQNRLHDRFQYETQRGCWKLERLAP